MKKSICLLISVGMSNGDESKRNVTDTETPILEEVALEEQLKDMKLELEQNDNGIRLPELPEVLENSDSNPYPYMQKLPQDSSLPAIKIITFIFLFFVGLLVVNHRRKIIAFILEGGKRRRSQRYTRITHT